MAGTVTRVQYFDHQFLQVGDFTTEQDYHREMLRVHNTSLHTAGVATGLTVTAPVGGTSASVTPGVAIDSDGNELVLAVQRDVDLSVLGATQTTGYLVMSYDEQNAAAASDGSGGYTRFTEDPKIEAQAAAPTDNLHLLLATVTWSGSAVTGVDSNPSGRLTAGAAGGDQAVNSLSIRVSNAVQANWPKFSAPASNQAELNCALAVDGALTAGGSASGGATINGPLTVHGNANTSGTMTVGGALTAASAALSGGLTAASGAVNGQLSVQGNVLWGENDSMLVTDQGGSIELGGNNLANGVGTPYVDFHYSGKQQDFNVRLINDSDGQLTLAGQPVGTANRLNVQGETGLRQQRLYMTGGTQASTWSSISFNSCHGLDPGGNVIWRFPDPTTPAVTIEMDAAANGAARFEVWTTRKAATQSFTRSLGINGETGLVTADYGLTWGNNSILKPDQGGSIELGGNESTAGSGTPYIDFHFRNGRVQDFNARIINSADGVLVMQGVDPNIFTVNVLGHFTTSFGKFFAIDHPADARRSLVHAVLEGPEHGLFYRGEGRLAGGRATIELPGYFEALCRPESRTVLVTPKVASDGSEVGALGATPVSDGKFTVVAGAGTDPNQAFYWEVKAVRGDIDNFEVEPIRGTTPQSPPHEPISSATSNPGGEQ